MRLRINRFWRSGYSLVEISLALLVIAVGFLTAFALFPEGLNQARRSVQETEIAAFAGFVFSGLDLETAITNDTWSSTFEAGLELMHSHSLQLAGQPRVRVFNNWNTISNFWWIPNFYAGPQLKLYQYKTALFTYNLRIGSIPGRDARYARLEVWPGQYATRPAWPGKVFYREYLASHTK